MVTTKRVCYHFFESFTSNLNSGFRFVPLPKSATPERIRSNAQLYDFELNPEEMAQLDGLDRGKEGAVSWNPVDAP
jgi:diketogulonate reductase-like aldo/keto reductase